jgi:hypothetical protein
MFDMQAIAKTVIKPSRVSIPIGQDSFHNTSKSKNQNALDTLTSIYNEGNKN